jgi:predicted kinase
MPALGKDDLKEFLFDKIGKEDKEWSADIGRVAVEMLYTYAEHMLGSGKDVLIENAFWKEFASQRVGEICEATNTSVLEIYCDTDAVTRSNRFNRRITDGLRHEGHADKPQILDESADAARYAPLSIGEVIMVDTTNLGHADYADILHAIENFAGGTKL